jgi:hypothetical protein
LKYVFAENIIFSREKTKESEKVFENISVVKIESSKLIH